MNSRDVTPTENYLIQQHSSAQDASADRVLVEAARGGNIDAFTQLVECHTERIYTLALHLLEGDTSEAEDATQEAFIRAYYHLSEFRGAATFASWLYRIMLNICRDQLRRRQVREQHADLRHVDQLWSDEHYTVDPERIVLAFEDRQVLDEALQQLPVSYRATVLLHDVEGLTMSEVATLMNVPLPTAKSRLRRARMTLVTLLNEYAQRSHQPEMTHMQMHCRSLLQEEGEQA